MIPRYADLTLERRLAESAAVVMLGPRQVGKTTLAREVADRRSPGAVYLDLERPADRRRLADPDGYLRAQAPRLVVLDEVHLDWPRVSASPARRSTGTSICCATSASSAGSRRGTSTPVNA
jgi:predicted AAA+ superfamily ATPase